MRRLDARLDDLLAEIGLGNAMSVVVAKNLQGESPVAAQPGTAPAANNSNLPIKGADGLHGHEFFRLFLVATNISARLMMDNQPFTWADVSCIA